MMMEMSDETNTKKIRIYFFQDYLYIVLYFDFLFFQEPAPIRESQKENFNSYIKKYHYDLLSGFFLPSTLKEYQGIAT